MPVAPGWRVDLRQSDPVLLFGNIPLTPAKRSRADAVTAVELLWRMPPPPSPLAPAKPGVLASHAARGTPNRDLASIARILDGEKRLEQAAQRLQQEICGALLASDALVLWIDWPLRLVLSSAGRVEPEVAELVLDVAGSGKRALVDGAVIEPIGAPPARVVLALRKPVGVAFGRSELAAISALSIGIAPTFDRLTRTTSRP